MALFNDHSTHEPVRAVNRWHFSRGFRQCLQIFCRCRSLRATATNVAAQDGWNPKHSIPLLGFDLRLSHCQLRSRRSVHCRPTCITTGSNDWGWWYVTKWVPMQYPVICWVTNSISNSNTYRVYGWNRHGFSPKALYFAGKLLLSHIMVTSYCLTIEIWCEWCELLNQNLLI